MNYNHNYTPNVVASKAKCPKCGSSTLSLIELWKGHSISWEQENGTFDRNDGALEHGDAYRVEALCRNKTCKHQWKIRGIIQIDEITL